MLTCDGAFHGATRYLEATEACVIGTASYNISCGKESKSYVLDKKPMRLCNPGSEPFHQKMSGCKALTRSFTVYF